MSQAGCKKANTRRWLHLAIHALVFTLIGPAAGAQGPATENTWVWWEGESAVETNFPAVSDFSPSTFPQKVDLLSGEDWLSNSGTRSEGSPPAFAKYLITTPADAVYHFWTRKFWKHGPFRWRFDEGTWQITPFEVALADRTPIRTYLEANWVYIGDVTLTAGPHTFELELLAEPGESLVAAFDAFLLTTGPFMPRGRLKPGESYGRAEPGFFPYEPAIDAFGPDALLDLSSLNEDVAGQNGFVRREGGRFVLGDGTPVRFWGVNVSSETAGQNRTSIDYLAKRLAKLGVNSVRYHSPIFDAGGPDPTYVPEKRLDDLFYLVQAMKQEGIYTTLSFYFPLWYNVLPEHGIPGYETIDNKHPFALLFFDERMQEIYRAWARKLFTSVNPYTGRTLAEEPAIAIVEIMNEDSFFFWTFSKDNIPQVHWEHLERLFGSWLEERYGSIEAALSTWGDASHEDDDPSSGRAGLYEAWFMTGDALRQLGDDMKRRIGDQVRFLTELQRGFYEDTVTFLREELGVQSLISASNWQVTDAALLDALERYTYTATDVLDRHGYFGGKHEGEGASYSVRVGHTYEDLAAVTVPDRLPLRLFQVEGHPSIISELGWTNPNRFRADATFLTSTYSALQGIDGIYLFAVSSNFMNDTSLDKFTTSSPVMAATFPAAALQFRRGDVQEAAPAVYQVLDLDDLYAMEGSGAGNPAALDALRLEQVPSGAEVEGPVEAFDPHSFYTGPLVWSFGEDADASYTRNLSDLIDRENKRITSLTGEAIWNYGTGVVRVDTPRSQGAAGFLGAAGEIRLSDVTIRSENEFASIMVIALDGQPLKTSKKILIQAMTEEKPYGFQAEDGVIRNLGEAPFGVKEIDATVTIRFDGPAEATITALDANGYAAREIAPDDAASDPSSLVVRLQKDALYHIIQR